MNATHLIFNNQHDIMNINNGCELPGKYSIFMQNRAWAFIQTKIIKSFKFCSEMLNTYYWFNFFKGLNYFHLLAYLPSNHKYYNINSIEINQYQLNLDNITIGN